MFEQVQARLALHREPEQISIKTDDEKYILVYSKRSYPREARQLSEKLQNLPDKTKLLWITVVTDELIEAIEQINHKSLSKLTIVSANSYSLKNNAKTDAETNYVFSLISNQTQLDYFKNSIEPFEKFEIVVHPSLQQSLEGRAFVELLQQTIRDAALRIKTIRHFECVWNYNFRRNQKMLPAISFLNRDVVVTKPQAMILGGKSVDLHYSQIKNFNAIWCADTALPALLYHGIVPQIVFSIDAGKGSIEHFLACPRKKISQIILIADYLSFPAVLRLPFAKKYFGASSHPLTQKVVNGDAAIFSNQRGDVYGKMMAVYRYFFAGSSLPMIFGFDQNKHFHHITHLRGSAYYRVAEYRRHRFYSGEQYFFDLSKRF